jgi:hypothetical protein
MDVKLTTPLLTPETIDPFIHKLMNLKAFLWIVPIVLCQLKKITYKDTPVPLAPVILSGVIGTNQFYS